MESARLAELGAVLGDLERRLSAINPAHRQPGNAPPASRVIGWLDTQGFPNGNLTYRNLLSQNPATFRTRLVKRTALMAELPEDTQKSYLASIPAGRFAEPEEVANVVRWIASDEAAYISGAVIPVDGGLGMGH